MLTKIVVAILFFVNVFQYSIAQNGALEILVPSKEVINTAQKEVKNYLLNLRDSLELSRREVRVRRFELKPTAITLEILNKTDVFDSNNFNCDDEVYEFEHIPKRQGSYYQSKFKFSCLGNIVDAETHYFLVVY